MLECVINVSEGRDPGIIGRLASAGGPHLLDIHSDSDHNRSVLTLCGRAEGGRGEPVERSVRSVAAASVELIDLRTHEGVHPRIGALDVVPFVALQAGRSGRLVDGPLPAAVEARDRFATWAGTALGLPCFLYGPERSLPKLRREAWTTTGPDRGPGRPHPTAGAAAVGARPVLVAYNVWLGGAGADLPLARRLAAAIRSPRLRTLGLQVEGHVQVSCNLVAPWQLGPGAAFDAVARALETAATAAPGGRSGGSAEAGIERAELVGLIPRAVLDSEPAHRLAELGLDPSATIEARLEQAGLDGGSF